MDYRQRVHRLQEKMKADEIDGFLMTQNVDIFYFTGTMQSGFLFIPAEGEAIFYVRRSLQRAQEESAVAVQELGSMRAFGDRVAKQFPSMFAAGAPVKLASEFDVLPVAAYRRLEAAFPAASWVDGAMLVRETRMIKSQDEIAAIKDAARVADLALEHGIARIRTGMADYELMSEIELVFRRNGHLGLMRMRAYNQELVTGMVGSGWAAAKPTYFDGPAGGEGMSRAFPQSSGSKIIGPNEPILLDIGCCIDGYVIDQTRTAVIGQLESELALAYGVAERILHETEAALRPGTVCQDLYMNALRLAEEAGLGRHFMGYGADQVKFLGHGIGLEIDELPILAKGFAYPLQPGMVIAIEPKFTFPGRGVVGIENTYAITDGGFEKLSFSREGLITVED